MASGYRSKMDMMTPIDTANITASPFLKHMSSTYIRAGSTLLRRLDFLVFNGNFPCRIQAESGRVEELAPTRLTVNESPESSEKARDEEAEILVRLLVCAHTETEVEVYSAYSFAKNI